MAVNRKKVWKQVCMSYVYTFISVVAMAIVMVIIIAITSRFGGGRLVVRFITITGGISFLMFLLSEAIVTILFKAEKPDPARYPNFINSVREIYRTRRLLWMFPFPKFLQPRLYVLKRPDLPNAMAFGFGFLGQCGIGITESLYRLLSREELKSVVAHEIAHVRCKDVGLMTVVVIITGAAEAAAKFFTSGKSPLGKGLPAFLVGGYIWFCAKVIFPVGRSAISQERELTADALGSLYVGTSRHLKSGLRKLHIELGAQLGPREKTAWDDLFITHPGMEVRIEALDELERN